LSNPPPGLLTFRLSTRSLHLPVTFFQAPGIPLPAWLLFRPPSAPASARRCSRSASFQPQVLPALFLCAMTGLFPLQRTRAAERIVLSFLFRLTLSATIGPACPIIFELPIFPRFSCEPSVGCFKAVSFPCPPFLTFRRTASAFPYFLLFHALGFPAEVGGNFYLLRGPLSEPPTGFFPETHLAFSPLGCNHGSEESDRLL